MKKEIRLAERVFEIRTEDWPFDDDERYCVELVEEELAKLATDERIAGDVAAALEHGRCDDSVVHILAAAWEAAASGYEFGVNEFACVLEIGMSAACGLPDEARQLSDARQLRLHHDRRAGRRSRAHCWRPA